VFVVRTIYDNEWVEHKIVLPTGETPKRGGHKKQPKLAEAPEIVRHAA
jgi:hypothetical protein